jgi:methionyl-tRNA synthetase
VELGKLNEKAKGAAHAARGKAHELKEKATPALKSAKDAVAEAAHQLTEKVDEVRHRGDKAPIFIGVAWPYANGGLHLGHIAGSLLPPDIFRRYKRMAGHDVLMVSGSDCHGTPILLKAEAEGKTPDEVANYFHEDHGRALERLGIGFDRFTKTTTANHEKIVQEFFLAAKSQGFIEKRTQQAPFDPTAGRFLPDRYVEGICPHCDFPDARGDQCDNCGKTLDPQELKSPRSKLNPDAAIEFRDTDHFFFLLSKLQPELEKFVAENAAHWRPNTINFTQNWLKEGLQDRPITRDLTWGVPIPLEGYDDKRIYVWFEAVCGYYTAAVEWGNERGTGAHNHTHWWENPATKGYYFLGKDNIPFHTIIWPAIITAVNKQRKTEGEPLLQLPYDVPANEFLNLDGKQFSKSRGISIAVHDVLDRFDADAVRYYLSINMPEQRDSDWTWDDFLAKVNDELVGSIGNLAHRILSFNHKNLGHVPKTTDETLDKVVLAAIQECQTDMAEHLDAVRLKKAIKRLLRFSQFGNQTMQEAAPWKVLKEDPDAGEAVLGSLFRILKAMSIFIAPYTPHAADKLWKMLGEAGSVHDAKWSDCTATLASGITTDEPKALFRKLDPADIPQAAPKPETKAEAEPASTSVAAGAELSSEPHTTETKENPMISFEEFQKLDLRIATVASVEDHPDADKLFVIMLDVGELGTRQVVAGLKGHYNPSDLVDQQVAFIANLAPVKLRGVESQGMILAGDSEGIVSVLNPGRALAPGARIR